MKTYSLVIIGGGSAGMEAALSAKENGIEDIVILEREHKLGGILNQCIHNGFGLQIFKEELSGPEYAQRFSDKVEQAGIEVKLNTHVIEVNKQKQITYVSESEGYTSIQAKAIIFALGCYERSAGAIALPGDRPYGIFTAGCAQKYINQHNIMVGKKVFILGSGDIGLIMARRMSLEGAQVLGVGEREPYSNGLMRNIVQCLDDYNIPLYTSHTVTSIKGKDHLESITISALDEQYQPIHGSEKTFEVDTLLLSVGLIPETTLMNQLQLTIDSATHSLKVNEQLEASMEGIFACGNALHVHDLVDYVTLEAKRAGRNASDYIKGKKRKNTQIETKAGNGIGYVLPQRIEHIEEAITMSLRVKRPFKKCSIVISLDGEIIKTIQKPYLLPAEMIMFPITLAKSGKQCTFEIKEEQL
ncbi:MAG: NAD(P)/FAD-dependent oxidoreductase [Erysipelotrichaceae bacterium]